MAQNSLVNDRIDSGARFLRQFGQKFPIQMAAWMKPNDSSQWYLYVSLEALAHKPIGPAYSEVFQSLRDLGDDEFDPFQIKLIRTDDPLARQLLSIRGPAKRRATVFHSSYIAGELFDEGYIYPKEPGTDI